MKNILYILLLCLLCTGVSADKLSANMLSAELLSADMLERLDLMLEQQPQQVARYADSLRMAASSFDSYTQNKESGLNEEASSLDSYTHNKQMYDAYSAFKYDSAYHYAAQNLLLVTTDPDNHTAFDLLDAQLDLLHILSAAGHFSEADLMLDMTRTTLAGMSDAPNSKLRRGTAKSRQNEGAAKDSALLERQIKFLTYATDLYIYKAEFANSPFTEQYIDSAMRYRLQTIELAPHDSYEYLFARAVYENETGNHDGAIVLMDSLLSTLQSGDRRYSVVSGTLAYFYRFKNDKDAQKYYFTLSAISDIEGNICETNSLRALATLLFEDGDIDRAYSYLFASVRDARFYGSRLRTYQTGQITPLIVEAWQQQQQANNRLLLLLLLVAALFVVLLVASVIATVIVMRRLDREGKIMQEQKQNIEQQNKLIKESNKIKLEYISRFMRLASDYITESEQTNKRLNRLMMDGKTDEVAKLLKNTALSQKDVQLFHKTFDTAFLNIYPSFISEVNALFREDSRMAEKEDERLTTELRILALLRLGITDNQEIADILRSSITTIYTYRSRLRSRAISPDTFEQDLMLIDAYLEEI